MTGHGVIYGFKTEICPELDNANQLADLAFLVDLTAYLHEFNICLQGEKPIPSPVF